MELVLPTYTLEILTTDFIYHGDFQPRGDVMTFVNDPRYNFYTLTDAHLHPVDAGYQFNRISQPVMNINRDKVVFISILTPEDAEDVQVINAKRPVVFYSRSFVVRGNIHVNPGYKDDDLIDDTNDFVAISEATIYPIKNVAAPLTRKVPMLVMNRLHTAAYHVHTEDEDGAVEA